VLDLFGGVADPHRFDADPDPACHFDAGLDPDPTFHFECGSGSGSMLLNKDSKP
jgi:hypothetical protein